MARADTRRLGIAVALLTARNLIEEPLSSAAYVPVNLATGAVIVTLARTGGSSWADLGLRWSHAGRGMRVGGVTAAITGCGILVGAALPVTRGFFDDERVDVSAGGGELAYQTLWRIPVGTVAFEELAFRGVLLALLRRSFSTKAAVAIDSAMFGLWHIVPSLAAARANDITGWSGAGYVAGSIVATAAAGVVFCALRLRGRHLVAPAMLHLAFNDISYLAAWLIRS